MFKLLTHIKHRNFFRLWMAQLISQFGDRIHQLALVGLIVERGGGSAFGLAKIMAFTIIPVFFIQPFSGVFVDRLDRRTILFVCDLIRGLLVLLIPLVFFYNESMVPIYVIVFLTFCFPRFYVPAKMSIIPELVDEEHILEANSLITTTGMIAAGLGVSVGAFLIEAVGARNGFIVDAITFFLSAVFLLNMNMSWKINYAHRAKSKKGMSIWREMKEGFDYIRANEDIRFVLNMLFVLFAAAGAVYVVLVVFIQEIFQSVTRDLGILIGCLVVGLFLGVSFYSKIGKKYEWHKTIFFCLCLSGVVMILFAILVNHTNSLAVAMFLCACLGAVIGPIFVAANTIAHIVSDKNMQGKVFSAIEIVINAAFLIFMMGSAFLAEHISHVLILSVIGILCMGVGGFGLIQRKSLGGLANQ